MQALNHEANTYLAVMLSSSSPYLSDPSLLATAHSSLTHLGQVGSLRDVQLLSVPKQDWERVQTDVLDSLKSKEGITGVDIQVPQRRAKRGGDEL